MSMPPIDQPETGLWMNIQDVFHIKGRGTVLTGRLDGQGQLNLGDHATCYGGSWKVVGIERFRATLTVAEPGMDIGILVNESPGYEFRGVTVYFEPSAATAMGPQFTVLPRKKKRWRG